MNIPDYLAYNVVHSSIAPHLRENEEWCYQQINNPRARTIVLCNGLVFLTKKPLPQLPKISVSSAHIEFLSLLALEGECPILLLDLSSFLSASVTASISDDSPVWTWLHNHLNHWGDDKRALDRSFAFYSVRECFDFLNAKDLSLVSLALGVSKWHKNSAFCGVCGGMMRVKRGGLSRYCQSCSQAVFPRINPAVIMLVENDNDGEKKCLLAHHSRLPKDRYSTIAGFVDMGESIENAVGREVFEEVGLSVKKLQYVTSQSWTFSSSLMLGFIATVEDWDIQLDTRELETAKWFSIAQLRQFGQENTAYHTFSLSSEDSIARYLINYWLRKNDK